MSLRIAIAAALILPAISVATAQRADHPAAAATILTNIAPAVTLNVDVSANRKPISPYIYGLNYAKPSFAAEIGLPVRRWGGNHTSRYNWQLNAMNHASDWFFHNNVHYDPFTFANETADQWVIQNKQTGAESLLTLPMTGYVAKNGNQNTCGFHRSHYPVQDHWNDADGFPDCGDGFNGGVPIVNDPLDTSIAVTQAFAGGWATHLTATHGTASSGGVKFYDLDNEPGLWHETHRDAHPIPLSYDESFARGSAYAAAVKAVDPGALILGPVQDGWTRYWYASYESQAQAEADRTNHGGTYFVPWYLQQMNAYQQIHGVRLLDYLDLHVYPQNGVALSTAGNANTQALRLRSTRALWDSTYVDESWIAAAGPDGGIVRLIPRMHDWVNTSYAGTRLATTEYNWGGLEHINGALTQADILGIFGREGIDLATLWNAGQEIDYNVFETLPGAYAFRMYRNYDGAGGRFGDTSVSATSSNQAQLSIYAAQRTSDSSLTLMIVNKAMTTSVTGTVNIAGFLSASSAQVYRYSDANLNAVVPLASQAVAGGGFTASFPANSITLVRVPTASVSAPTVVSGAASAIGVFAATLNGTANPNGGATTGHFEYGLTTGYGLTTMDQAIGSGSGAVAIGGGVVTGLTCNTPYHFRAVATNTGGTTHGLDATFTTSSSPCITTTGDFDGDAKADVAVYRPSTGGWHVLKSSAGYASSQSFSWGLSTDKPVPGDYDGDGRMDPAVYRPSTGAWHILKSSTSYTTSVSLSWGLSTDLPEPGDYDGDARTDPAVYRPSTGGWYVLKSSANYTTSFGVSWGLSTDVPVQGDYDGDGKADPAVYRPSTGGWYVLKSGANFTTSVGVSWGLSTDVPVPGDYDGDGKIDPAVFRPSTGGWYILKSSTSYTTSAGVLWGLSTDVPVPGDFDGDRKIDPAVFRPSTGGWYILKSSANYTTSFGVSWGLSTDVPILRRP